MIFIGRVKNLEILYNQKVSRPTVDLYPLLIQSVHYLNLKHYYSNRVVKHCNKVRVTGKDLEKYTGNSEQRITSIITIPHSLFYAM